MRRRSLFIQHGLDETCYLPACNIYIYLHAGYIRYQSSGIFMFLVGSFFPFPKCKWMCRCRCRAAWGIVAFSGELGFGIDSFSFFFLCGA